MKFITFFVLSFTFTSFIPLTSQAETAAKARALEITPQRYDIFKYYGINPVGKESFSSYCEDQKKLSPSQACVMIGALAARAFPAVEAVPEIGVLTAQIATKLGPLVASPWTWVACGVVSTGTVLYFHGRDQVPIVSQALIQEAGRAELRTGEPSEIWATTIAPSQIPYDHSITETKWLYDPVPIFHTEDSDPGTASAEAPPVQAPPAVGLDGDEKEALDGLAKALGRGDAEKGRREIERAREDSFVRGKVLEGARHSPIPERTKRALGKVGIH